MNTVANTSEFQEDAQLVIEVFGEKEKVQLDFSADSVSWLDTYIDEHRAELDEGEKHLLQEKFGAFLGESILRNFGGQWVKSSEDRWMIAFGGQKQTSPFELIGEHLDHHTSLTQVFRHMPEHLGRNAAKN